MTEHMVRTRTAVCAHCEREWRAEVKVGGASAYCPDCRPTARLVRKNLNSARYRANNRETIAAAQKRWADANRDKIRADHLRRQYGLTPDMYAQLLALQGGGCALCGSADCQSGRNLAVDHDHDCCPARSQSCGECVRGILCYSCNSKLLPCYEALPEHCRDSAFLNAYLAGRPLTTIGSE